MATVYRAGDDERLKASAWKSLAKVEFARALEAASDERYDDEVSHCKKADEFYSRAIAALSRLDETTRAMGLTYIDRAKVRVKLRHDAVIIDAQMASELLAKVGEDRYNHGRALFYKACGYAQSGNQAAARELAEQ